LALLGLLAGIVIVSLLQAREKYDQQFEAPPIFPTEQQINRQTPSGTVDTDSWQTYQNEEYGFEVKVPRDWIAATTPEYGSIECQEATGREALVMFSRDSLEVSAEQCGFAVHTTPPSNAEVTIWILDDPYNDINTILQPPKENIIIAGEEATMYRFSYQQARPNVNAARIYFNHAGKGYLIFLKNQNEEGTSYDPLYNQILSTLRFIDSDFIDTSTWRYIKFPESYAHNFDIPIPPNWRSSCCNDTDVYSAHVLLPILSGSENGYIVVYDFSLGGCPDGTLRCSIDEKIRFSPMQYFEARRKAIEEGEFDLRQLNSVGSAYIPSLGITSEKYIGYVISNWKTSRDEVPIEYYLVNTGEGVSAVEFIKPEKMERVFINEFLAHIRSR
jgi:hypothetical protein